MHAPIRFALLISFIAAGSSCGDAARAPDPLSGSGREPSTALRTASERRGREIYGRQKCGRCHTLFQAPPPTGAFSLPDPSNLPVGSRVGPDLGSEGHRHSDDWHYAHLYAPLSVVGGSKMPASRHLFTAGPEGSPVPTGDAVDLVAYLQALGRGERDVWAAYRRQEPAVPDPPITDETLRGRGAQLYRRLCAGCHGVNGDGTGEAAVLLDTPPRDFANDIFRFKSTPQTEPPTDRDIFRAITLGTGTGSAMPGFMWLSERDRWSLVTQVMDLSPQLRDNRASDPAVRLQNARSSGNGDPGSGAALRDGRRLWDELGCASCHGSDGSGQPGSPKVAAGPEGVWRPDPGSLRHPCDLNGGASVEAIERIVVTGAGLSMPSYGEYLQDPEARRALATYVRSLQDAP